MQKKKMICIVLTFVLIIGALPFPANAAEVEESAQSNFLMTLSDTRATGSFSMSIAAKTKSLAESSFSLAAGETVTIKASYIPFDASVDFGLVDSDGVFHYFNITDGSIDKTILIEETGKYTLQVRNNSSGEVKVSGFVNY